MNNHQHFLLSLCWFSTLVRSFTDNEWKETEPGPTPFVQKRDIRPANQWKMDLIPVTMNSIPKAINSSPIIRVMTLMPVCPNSRTSHGAMRNSPQQHRANSAIATKKPNRLIALWYRVPQTIVELIAPGPAINGNANGTTPILSRIAVSDFSCLFCLSSLVFR